MTDRDNPASIEADIERDRAAFASTLGALEDRISVERLAEEALGLIRTNAASYGKTVDRAVRANPLALAMIATGIAWLVLGKKRPAAPPSKPEAITRWEGEGGSTSYPPTTAYAADDADWLQTIEDMRAKAALRLNEITQASRTVVGTARSYADEKAEVVADLIEGMKEGFRQGLDGLSDSARDSIVVARQKAYKARRQATEAVKATVSTPGLMIEDHPLAAGAIALAAGAALAASLPRTESEDRLFGNESDRLMREAANLLRQEKDRAARLAAEVKEELKDSAKEALHNLSAVAADSAERLREKAMGDTGA